MDRSSMGLLTRESVVIPLTGVEVRGDITGRAARVCVSQHFQNTSPKVLEAVYKFPLPEGSSVCGFKAIRNGKVIRGKIEENEKAFETYDDALSKGNGAYLLDEERPNIFTLSVGNINPGNEVVIEIEYVTFLDTNGPDVRFFLPTTISPRYLPADQPDVNGVPASGVINPPVALSVNYGLKLFVNVHGMKEIAMLESPSHSVSTTYKDESIVVELASETTAMDRDFILNVKYKNDFNTKGYCYRTGNESYIQLDISAIATKDLSSPASMAEHEVIFILDCSGSMRGSSINEAKAALDILLKALEPNTFFNIYRFGSNFNCLFRESPAYNARQLETALIYLSNTDANLGGTEFLAPLLDVERKLKPGRITKVVLLTDGQVGNEEQILDLIRKNQGRMQLFTVGIGNGPNEYFIKQLARLSDGAFELISPNERIEPRVLRLFRKISSADSVKDLEINWGTEAVTTLIPSLVHSGETVSVFAKCEGIEATGKVVISGRTGDSRNEWAVSPLQIEGDAVPIPVLWAREKIREYEESGTATVGSRQYQRKHDRVKKAIIDLSKQYGVISRETSFVAVEERDEIEKSTGEVELVKIPVMLTNGWGGVNFMTRDLREIDRYSLRIDTPNAPMYSPRMMRVPSDVRHEFKEVSNVVESKHRDVFPAVDNGLLRILSLQLADGGFSIDDDFARLVNKSISELHAIAESIRVDGRVDKFKLLSTALVIVYLERTYKNDKNYWEAVVQKSRNWLSSIVATKMPTIEGIELLVWVDQFLG